MDESMKPCDPDPVLVKYKSDFRALTLSNTESTAAHDF